MAHGGVVVSELRHSSNNGGNKWFGVNLSLDTSKLSGSYYVAVRLRVVSGSGSSYLNGSFSIIGK